MLNGVSFDQLRIFICAVDEGSFSAAARKLFRAQSAISEQIRQLEEQVGVALFLRTGRYPKLTPEGAVLLADARNIIANVDGLLTRAKGMADGLEAELAVVIDVFYPLKAITCAARAFQLEFPNTPLRLYVEALGGIYQPVIEGRASFAVAGPLPERPSSLASESLPSISFTMVAASEHPLAQYKGIIPRRELAKHVQLVLTDRSTLSDGQEAGIMSPLTWRLADLFAKRAFLLDGLGWGGMPLHTVSEDIASGKLVVLQIENVAADHLHLPMSAVYPCIAPPGPAGRWLIERLKQAVAD